MSKNIVEELPARKHTPVAAPVAKKEGVKPAGNTNQSSDKKVVQKGGTSEEASAKRIKQAVYDIRYRARKDDIELSIAFQQYMSNSNLSAKEVAAVREKLGLGKSSSVKEQFTKGADDWATDGLANALYKVFVEQEDPEFELSYVRKLEESEERKYKVRVTDTNGKTYVRYADRAKITELRGNSNIKSVEMTEHGTVVGSERNQGKQTAKAKAGKGLDPVGKEDSDIDNDGKPNDKNDKYIRNRREKIGQSIRMRAEEKLREGTTSVEAPPGTRKVKEDRTIDNHAAGVVKVNPTDKQEDPSDGKTRYAHLQLLGTNLSESQKKLLELVAEKKACAAKKKKEAEYAKEDADYGYDKEGKSLNPKDKKEEEKKDMRGYYAKINVVKNRLRSMGAKNPCVIADPDDVEKIWDKNKKKDDDVKEGVWTKDKDGKRQYVDGRPERARKKYGDLKDKVDGSKERTAADPGMPGRMGRPNKGPNDSVKGPADKKPAPPKGDKGPKTKKPTPPKERYNPFTKDGKTRPGDRTPTSASQTTGP